MKSILLILVFVYLAISASAQSFIGGGQSFGAVVGKGANGQNKAIGGFCEGTYSRKVVGVQFDFNRLATLEHAPKRGTTSASI